MYQTNICICKYLYETNVCVRQIFASKKALSDIRERPTYIHQRSILHQRSIYMKEIDLCIHQRAIRESCVCMFYIRDRCVQRRCIFKKEISTYIIERSIYASEVHTCVRDVYTYIIERPCGPWVYIYTWEIHILI